MTTQVALTNRVPQVTMLPSLDSPVAEELQ
jgi:hypothetical protein